MTAVQALQRLPGVGDLLRIRREVSRRTGRRLRPPRPPFGPPDQVARLGAAPAGEAFITGNGIAARCRYVLNYDRFQINDQIDNDWWFCRADYLEYFFRHHAPRDRFVLFSHNSDRGIGERFRRELRRRRLVAWFAQNPLVDHPKLRALPLGVANPFWEHGDQSVLKRVREARPDKTALFDVSFSLGTNPWERRHCLDQTGLEQAPRRPFPDYLEGLASAYFCISPRGNGIDTVRTWEALYLRTVPVVTRSLLTDHHPDLPMVVLDDWSQFSELEFGPELYARTWGDWDPAALRLDRYLERVETIIAQLRTREA